MAFETVSQATRLWIKGREFTVSRLLGDAYKTEADRYAGGALVIFRLAPQDYHRFHSPVDGTIGPMTHIAGEYYTVNVSGFPRGASLPNASLLRLAVCSRRQSGRRWTCSARTCGRSYRLIVRNLAA